MRTFCKVLIFGVCIFFIFGCSPSLVSENVAPEEASPLQEVYWKVIGVKGKVLLQDENQRAPYLLFKIENTRVQGFSGCNILMGTYTLDANAQIRFSKMASTRMACPYSNAEEQFLRALEEVHTYWIDKEVLTLGSFTKEPLVIFEAVYTE